MLPLLLLRHPFPSHSFIHSFTVRHFPPDASGHMHRHMHGTPTGNPHESCKQLQRNVHSSSLVMFLSLAPTLKDKASWDTRWLGKKQGPGRERRHSLAQDISTGVGSVSWQVTGSQAQPQIELEVRAQANQSVSQLAGEMAQKERSVRSKAQNPSTQVTVRWLWWPACNLDLGQAMTGDTRGKQGS